MPKQGILILGNSFKKMPLILGNRNGHKSLFKENANVIFSEPIREMIWSAVTEQIIFSA